MVPSYEKSAVFCDNGRICPSQNAHPLGAKLKGKIRISATNGSATFSSSSMTPVYVWLGKIPNSEMMKLMQRYGWKLLCG